MAAQLEAPPSSYFSIQAFQASSSLAWLSLIQTGSCLMIFANASGEAGILGSIALVRGKLPGKAFVRALTLSPMVVPHFVIAVAIYRFFAPIGLTGNFSAVLIAHTMLSVSYSHANHRGGVYGADDLHVDADGGTQFLQSRKRN